MATTYIHTRMGVIDANGDTNILYPQNTATDVTLSTSGNTEIPGTVTNVQLLADALAASAFAIPIDDTSTTSTTKSWSANKINSELSQLNSNLEERIDNLKSRKIYTATNLTSLRNYISSHMKKYDVINSFIVCYNKGRIFRSYYAEDTTGYVSEYSYGTMFYYDNKCFLDIFDKNVCKEIAIGHNIYDITPPGYMELYEYF